MLAFVKDTQCRKLYFTCWVPAWKQHNVTTQSLSLLTLPTETTQNQAQTTCWAINGQALVTTVW